MACLEIWHRAHVVECFKLEVLAGDRIETWVQLPAERLSIRRGHIKMGPQIRIAHGRVSKRNHAEIAPKGEGFVVRDAHSVNGTFVNDLQLVGGADHVLRDGDIIHFRDERDVADERDRSATVIFHDGPGAYTCEATEQALVALVCARTDNSRAVYADWLEDRGDLARADFLRARDVLDRLVAGSAYDEQVRACYSGNATVDPAWRLAVLTDTRGALDRST